MGTDIHAVVEHCREVRGSIRWVGLHAFETITVTGERDPVTWEWTYLGEGRPAFRTRDYWFFNTLAGVRFEKSERGHTPKGLPADVSDLAWTEHARDDTDAHSASWLPLIEVARCLLLHRERRPDVFGKLPFEAPDEAQILGWLGSRVFAADLWFDSADWDDYRLVFWFDS